MAVAGGLTLVTRRQCGLCEELAGELQRLGVSFTPLDVDEDPRLLNSYNNAVPVLLKDGAELGRAPFTDMGLKQLLRRAGELT